MKLNILLGLVLSVVVHSAGAVAADSANKLIIVGDQSKAADSFYSLDFQSDGNATALELRLQVAGGKRVKVDTRSCAKSLPKSHTGSCVFNGKELVVLVYSERNALLPVGLLDLGTVRISGVTNKKAIAVSSFIAGSPSGQAVSSSTSVE